jgi:CheY-like chemotaxis protein
LPLRCSTHPDGAMSSVDPFRRQSALSASGRSILVVEDNPHMAEMFGYALRKLGGELSGKVAIEAQFAADGHAALARLWERPFDLVITDLYMPVMDGFALIDRIRRDVKLQHIPVLAISAGDANAQQRALGLGVNIYLRKPVKFAQVLETVKHLLALE